MAAFLLVLIAQRVCAERWAVLVAGSRGFENYRHQADLCHAHLLLRSRGFTQERLVSLSADDAAFSALNPFPGKLFNEPSTSLGFNVRESCNLTFRGSEASLSNFRKLLSAYSLKTCREDTLFLNFVDHGCAGRLLFPDGNLSARELVRILWRLRLREIFGKILIFVEACESGSLFEGFALPPQVLAITASNASEASWGVFCPASDDVVAGQHLGTCLGDLFSVSWMRQIEASPDDAPLHAFLLRVAKATLRSEVNYYGDTALLNISVAAFFRVER